jgi:single-strand DNA-binding protein
MIHCTIVGRLGRDARAIPGATGGASFSVACDHGYGDKRTTTWVDVTVWGKRGAGMLERGLLPKGQIVAVRGELWTEDREGKTWVKVSADEVELLGGKPQGADAAPRVRPVPSDDEIPF